MVRGLLERAAGYVVYGSDGRRIGAFVELVPRSGQRGDSVAIRCDGILLWRRRVVPVAVVAGVAPKERTVTLLLDQDGIERAHELQPDERRAGSVADRVARYGAAAAAAAGADARPIDTNAPTNPGPAQESGALGTVPPADGAASPRTDTVGEAAFAQHVLFVPTAAGYVFIERRGAPPRCTGKIDLHDPPGSFTVVKLAQSPLPNDGRVCAYLERLD